MIPGSVLPQLRDARRRRSPDRAGRAGPEDRRRFLQEGRQGDPAPRPGAGTYVTGGAKADTDRRPHPEKKPAAERLKLLRESARIRRRSSCGRSCATRSTTAAVPPEGHRRLRARDRLRHALGLRLATSARSSCGRTPAGSRSPSGSRKTSRPARRCPPQRCPPGCSTAATACTPPEGSWSAAQSKYLPVSTLDVYKRQPFPRPCWAPAAPTR